MYHVNPTGASHTGAGWIRRRTNKKQRHRTNKSKQTAAVADAVHPVVAMHHKSRGRSLRRPYIGAS